MVKNLGVKIKGPEKSDKLLGAKEHEIINPDGDWSFYIPPEELQHFNNFDSLGCISWSALNCIETILDFKYGVNINFSDRFTAKMSGTTKSGNSCIAVASSIVNDGLVRQSDYPSKEAISWNDFYKPISQDIKDKGIESTELYNIEYEWIVPSSLANRLLTLEEALKYGPVQVIVHAWDESRKDGDIYLRTNKPFNHAVELIKATINYWLVYDHYRKVFKKLAKDFKIDFAFQYYINRIKPMKFIKEKDNNAVYLINNKKATPINSARDYFNLEENWNSVEEVDKLDMEISDEKLYTFVA